jgi:prolyl 4-hydroxylase|tara:strand:+ start:840 stop:2123 length:1284 start_codon:yes stop_codon:yes gene_type:complete
MEEIHNFLTQDECQELINLIDANHIRSSVVVGGTDRTDVTEHRTSSTTNFDMNTPLMLKIKSKIADTLGLELQKGEAIQGQLYEPGQYFKPHNDFFSGPAYDMHCKASGNRTHTLMVYLNEDFKGGGTYFPTLEKTIQPETGKALWWYNMKDGKTQEQYLHEGVTVDEGKKYIITSWWREKGWDGAGDEKMYYDSVEEKPKDVLQEKLAGKSYFVKASELERKEPVITKTDTPKVFTSKDQIPKFTELGFALQKCPAETWNIINDSYQLLKDRAVNEEFDGKEIMIKGGDTEILSFDALPSIRTLIHNQLLPVHQQWINNEDIEPSFIYGIRSYKKGATLEKHYDRVETHHISSIIIVDKNLACGCSNKPESDDWPLDIQGHDGEWYKVYAQPGDMILYESAICEHGREEPFGGTFFRNFYVHYKIK